MSKRHPKPEKCPHCGAVEQQREQSHRFWECDSYWQYLSGRARQSDRCEVRVQAARIRQLEAELAEARELLESAKAVYECLLEARPVSRDARYGLITAIRRAEGDSSHSGTTPHTSSSHRAE